MSEGYDYHLISTEEQLDALCAELWDAPILAVDTETEGIGYSDVIVGIALSHRPNSGYYIPIRHEAVDGIRHDNQLEPDVVFDKLRPLLETKPCTGHNAKFDLKMFWKDNININYVHDTLVMAHVLGFSANGARGLKQLVKHVFEHEMNDIDSLFPRVGNRKPDIRPKILSPEDISFYGCEDGNWTLRLYLHLVPMFRSRPKLKAVYANEMRLLRVVSEMESFGVPVSFDFLQTNSKRALEYIDALEESILSNIREALEDPEYEINLKSTKQLSKLLFDHLQLPILKTSPKTGAPSTDAAVLQELAKISPVVRSIMTYRDLGKLNNTYLHGLQDKVHSDGRIRGNFNQSGTASGRFSSSNPNLQNLPKDQTFTLWEVPEEDIKDVSEAFMGLYPVLRKSEEGAWESLNQENGLWEDCYLGEQNGKGYGVANGKLYEMWRCKTRDFIEAPEDHYLIEADYSQVELRIMAGESQEETLLDAYEKGDDVHTRTAAVVFDEPLEHVTKEQRHVGKTVNFSLLYGAGPFNISQQLGIEVEEAQEIVNRYFTNLPSILSWINRVKSDTKMDGYAETLFGRRRDFPNVRGTDRKLAEKELRESVNHHIQGAAADIMKRALVRASAMLREHFGDDVRIISTVHDSLLLECHNSCPVDSVIAVLKEAMEKITIDRAQDEAYKAGKIDTVTVTSGWPPLVIDSKVGPSWGSSKDYEPEALPSLPAKVNASSLPKIRVRKVAVERETPDPDTEVIWNIKINKPLTDQDLTWITEFLSKKRSDATSSKVRLTFMDEDGNLLEESLTEHYAISFDDEIDLRARLGPCKVTQDMEGLDFVEVLKGVDFGL